MTKLPFSYTVVRFSDCDPLGHLNNARYIDYFLNAREDHLKNKYGLELNQFYERGFAWLVRSHEISYLKPARYNEIVCIQSSLVKAAEDFLLVEMKMMDEKQVDIKAVIRTIFVSVESKTGRRQKHTDEFMVFARQIERPESVRS